MVAEDDEEVTCKTGSTTSMKSKISAIHLQSPHLREQPKTHGCLSPPTEPTTEPSNPPPPPVLIAVFLPVSHYIATQLSRLSVEVITKQQRPSNPFTLLLSPHLFPSNLKTNEIQYKIKRSGRLQGLLVRDEGERAMNTRCVRREYGCSNAS